MEKSQQGSILLKFKKLFFKGPRAFSNRQEINWEYIRKASIVLVLVMILIVLFLPGKETEELDFHQKENLAEAGSSSAENSATEDTLSQLQKSSGFSKSVPNSLNSNYAITPNGGQTGLGNEKNERTSSMILRNESNSRGKILAGTRFVVKINGPINVKNQNYPVTASVINGVISDNSMAIPEGAKLCGEASLDDSSERAIISFQTIILPNGNERPISASVIGPDGGNGIEGKIHSHIIQNVIGHSFTRFVGAYAEGSLSRGELGASSGGHNEGIKNAVSQTAKDYAENFGEKLKTETKWLEITDGQVAEVLLNLPFIFIEPGALNGF